MKKNYRVIKEDCIKWMKQQKVKSIDCVVTSPPYNLNIQYANYDDSISRKKYLEWLKEVSKGLKRVLKDQGQIFLNMGLL